jgi:hypothetical protein
LIFTTVVVFDSTIVDFSSYSGVRLQTWLNVAIFVIFAIIFVASSTILLNSVRNSMSTHAYKPAPPLGLRYFHRIISTSSTCYQHNTWAPRIAVLEMDSNFAGHKTIKKGFSNHHLLNAFCNFTKDKVMTFYLCLCTSVFLSFSSFT